MDFALMTEPQLGATYEQQLAAARYAEERGLAAFARADHYLSSRPVPHATDALAVLSGLARDTSTIGLTVLVSPISFRHPAVIVKSATTIDEMSGGRLSLGVGSGWMELEHEAFGLELWPVAERFARLTEALHYIRAALSPGAFGFEGDYYSLAEIDVRPKPTGPMPIIVGGGGARLTPRLAGRFADEYNLFPMTPGDIEPRVAAMRTAAEEAERDPDAIAISMMGPVLVGVDRAGYEARLAAAAADRDRSPAELEGRYRELGLPIGTPDEAQETLAGLAAAGVQRFYVQHLDLEPFRPEAVDEVLACLRA